MCQMIQMIGRLWTSETKFNNFILHLNRHNILSRPIFVTDCCSTLMPAVWQNALRCLDNILFAAKLLTQSQPDWGPDSSVIGGQLSSSFPPRGSAGKRRSDVNGMNWHISLSNYIAGYSCSVRYTSFRTVMDWNKCIGDDTKAAARRRLNCIKNQKKIKYGEERFSIWRMEFLHPAMWHDRNIDFARWLHPAMWHVALESWQWIHQVASTLQCDTWLWDDMVLNSPKRPPY